MLKSHIVFAVFVVSLASFASANSTADVDPSSKQIDCPQSKTSFEDQFEWDSGVPVGVESENRDTRIT